MDTNTTDNTHPGDQGSSEFTLADLDYDLPPDLIAQHPAANREDARLLVVDRADGSLHDRSIRDLPDLLDPADLLVLNNTKVLPARFVCRRATGGIVRGLFLADRGQGMWQVMLEGSRRLRSGENLQFEATDPGGDAPVMELTRHLEQGNWIVRVGESESAFSLLDRIGRAALPPYVHRSRDDSTEVTRKDLARYQTVYAEVPGAVAAPTAGLHFTDSLLAELQRRGVSQTCVTLHVGAGTFKPIEASRIQDHKMHREWFDFPVQAADAIRECRASGGRVLAVGTTSVRVLESAPPQPGSCSGWTDLLIHPPYQFRNVDRLLTNFHLPRSTLLALAMAFAGVDLIKKGYQHAIDAAYRFYSYGDAMLIR